MTDTMLPPIPVVDDPAVQRVLNRTIEKWLEENPNPRRLAPPVARAAAPEIDYGTLERSLTAIQNRVDAMRLEYERTGRITPLESDE